jgi:hypothetical protein
MLQTNQKASLTASFLMVLAESEDCEPDSPTSFISII